MRAFSVASLAVVHPSVIIISDSGTKGLEFKTPNKYDRFSSGRIFGIYSAAFLQQKSGSKASV